MGNCDADIDSEVNRVIDQILREDRLESIGLNPSQDSCEADCGEGDEQRTKNCAVETSARFSIRILEALRAVQRQKSGCRLVSSTMKEVVQYIRSHYNHDGDLCSQVETALNQVTHQGFVLRMGVNRYRLVGPFACSVLNPPAPQRGCDRDRSNCSSGGKSSCCRSRKRTCTPIANSTFADYTDPAPIGRGSRLSEVKDDPQRPGFQHRNNRERSFIREPGDRNSINQDQDISILQNIQAPEPIQLIERPGGNGEMIPGHIDDEIGLPPLANPPIRRPGGNGRVRVIRDHSIDGVEREIDPPGQDEHFGRHGCGQDLNDQSSEEIVGEIDPLDPDGGMQRPGPCAQVVREHSSEENMYREEPSMNVTRERRRHQNPWRRRRRNCSSRNSRDLICRSAARRCRRDDSNCGSEADISDETTDDERQGAKPWVRRCQKMFNRRHRRYSTCAYD